MARIDLTRYAEDKSCATPEGLKARLMAELMPRMESIDVQRNRCLVATYIRPNISPGGIIMTNKTIEEDRWQGKVGLLLKCGKAAFMFDEITAMISDIQQSHLETPYDDALAAALDYYQIPVVGDWIAYRTSETHEIGIEVERGVYASCRIIYDDSVIMRVDDPSAIW